MRKVERKTVTYLGRWAGRQEDNQTGKTGRQGHKETGKQEDRAIVKQVDRKAE
jgi:hypothetical protein